MGRYALHDRIASGGMASVHLGRLRGEGGFARIVAIKRLHPHLGQDPVFVSMFLDEARLVARIRHPNVIPTLDVIAADGEMLLVMDYVPGESLARLAQSAMARGERLPPRIAAAVLCGALHGLQAAHDACDEQGAPLHIVHRDVSPQNILVGTDGIARLLDFGVAKARSRLSETRDGEIKGKLAYMAPEQLDEQKADRRTDVYAAGIVLWEALTGQRFHGEATEASIVERTLYGKAQPPTAMVPSLPAEVDAVVLRALSRDPEDRYPTAGEMADALEAALGLASMSEVSQWVMRSAGEELARRASLVAHVESSAMAAPASTAALPESTPAAANDDTLADGRPSRQGVLAFGVDTSVVDAAGTGARQRVRRQRVATMGIALGGAAILVLSFVAVRSLATNLTGAGAPATSAETSLPSPAAPPQTATTTVATAASTPTPLAVVASPSASASSTAPPAVQPRPSAVKPRARPGPGRASSTLPAGLPSERQ